MLEQYERVVVTFVFPWVMVVVYDDGDDDDVMVEGVDYMGQVYVPCKADLVYVECVVLVYLVLVYEEYVGHYQVHVNVYAFLLV